MKTVYIFLAEGFEEIEAVTPGDILRRAGVTVKFVSCGKQTAVCGAHNVTYLADELISNIKADDPLPDAVVLPGGMPGATNLAACKPLEDLVKRMNQDSRVVAAICASPAVVLSHFGVLEGKCATCYPGMYDRAPEGSQISWQNARLVVDGNIITSAGPGTAGEFGFAIADALLGPGASAKVKAGMLYQ